MGKRLGIAGFQNTGKSFTRRYIPDGDRCFVIAPSQKASYLYKGPEKAHELSTDDIDAAIKAGKRRMLGDFDITYPGDKGFANLQEALIKALPKLGNPDNPSIHHVLDYFMKNKKPGFIKPEFVRGNTLFAPEFWQVKIATLFVNYFMPWVHTLILPDFTHFITEAITSDKFLNQKYGNEAFSRYLETAAEGFKEFIRSSDHLRSDLIVVTEYHVEWKEDLKRFELFVPGGKMIKEKFLPSSYYDQFLFTDVKQDELEEDAEPEYRYVTRRTARYPEARSGGLFDSKDELYIPNNIQEVLTRMRQHYNIPVKY